MCPYGLFKFTDYQQEKGCIHFQMGAQPRTGKQIKTNVSLSVLGYNKRYG